jgi:hypothetical protein
MRKLFAALMIFCMIFALVGCGLKEVGMSEEESYRAFRADLEKTSALALNARVEKMFDGSRMLMADVKNNTSTNEDITDIVISFATWNTNGKFVIIKSNELPDNKYELFEVTMDGIVVKGGETWSATLGLPLDEKCDDIKYVEAIVCTCKIGGKEYKNPMYDAWQETYIGRGTSLKSWMMDDVKPPETDPEPILTREERFPGFKANIDAQPLQTMNKRVEKSETLPYLLTDLKNNGDKIVKKISVAFVAWDAEGNPILLKGENDTGNGIYVRVVNYSEVLEPGQTWLASNGIDITGFAITNENIHTVEAVVAAYETADGETVSNPFYSEWVEMYGGNKYETWMAPSES